MEAAVLDENGITGYLSLSGALLFSIIIVVVNFKILSMSTGVRPLNTIVVVISIVLYWASQALVGVIFSSNNEFVLLKEEWRK